MRTALDKALSTLPLLAQLHALRRLDRLLPLLAPTHDACVCGALNDTAALLCGACHRNLCEDLAPLSLVGAAQVIEERRHGFRRSPAVEAERARRKLQDAFLRAVSADARTANLLAARWVWELDSEVLS